MNKLALLLCCVLLCGVALCCPVAAEELCALRVTLLDEQEQPAQDINVELCRISDAQGLTEDFAALPLSFEELSSGLTAEQAEQVFQYTIAHQLQGIIEVTGDKGVVDFTFLPQGIYLVFERGDQIVSFQPYLVQLPTVSGGASYNTVYSAPKVISSGSHNIMVKIEWIDNDNARGKRPQSVDVVLTRDTEMSRSAAPFRRVTLNSQCDWQHTFHMLPLSGSYGVMESAVPEYQYLGCEEVYEGFILTYRYQPGNPPGPGGGPTPPAPQDPAVPTLPQTGFRTWPIYLMLLGGTALVIWGMADLCTNKESVCDEE